jgi:creatinine amidohydrolase/Fe(II)-dependent formamide hydrolase-like protein
MFIIILPYGTDAALAASVAETVRQRRAAGVVYAIEYRQSPP